MPDKNGWYPISDTENAKDGMSYLIWVDPVGIALGTFFKKGAFMKTFFQGSLEEMLTSTEGQIAKEDGFYFEEVYETTSEWIKFGKAATHWRPEPDPPEGKKARSVEDSIQSIKKKGK